MPFTEKYSENKEWAVPIDVDSPEKLERYLSLTEPFNQNFKLEAGSNEELVEKLDENHESFVYRGMSPEYVFHLISGKKINIKPYKYEDIDPDNPPEENLQNASFLYSNAIMHGYDRKDDGYNFLSAVGFKPKGFILQGTGRKMAERLLGAGDISSVPEDKEKDITVEGELELKNIQVFCFRFREGEGFKTLVYRRMEEPKAPASEQEKKEDWTDYFCRINEYVEKNDPYRLERLLIKKHPTFPGEKEAYMWLKKNPKLKRKPRVKLDKSGFHVVPMAQRKK